MSEVTLPAHREAAVVDGIASQIGRDPRKMTEADLNTVGHHKRPLLRVIRQNCIDCSGGSELEVRRCAMVACPFWPYRMNSNPFVRRIVPEIRKQEAAQRLRVGRERKAAASDPGTNLKG